jgi:hypothetical protein
MTSEEVTVKNIQQFGWTVINVFGDEELNPYSYTIGLTKTFNHPEIVISGLDGEKACKILNLIGDNIKKGKIYANSKIQYDDILEKYNCEFKVINSQLYESLFGRAEWFYQKEIFDVFQCIYPDNLNRLPEHEDYTMTIQDLLFKF